MMHLGQLVWDVTNQRPMIYGGFAMHELTNKKDPDDYRLVTVGTYMDEDLIEYISVNDPADKIKFEEDDLTKVFYKELPFKCINFSRGANPKDPDNIPCGTFMVVAGSAGCFFGSLDFAIVRKNHIFVEAALQTMRAAKTYTKPVLVEKVKAKMEVGDNAV